MEEAIKMQFYGSPDREGNQKAVQVTHLQSGHVFFGFAKNGHVSDGVVMNWQTAAALVKRLKNEISIAKNYSHEQTS
jgi:Ethanolamine utilization protein EutJ (predicted chaperonin)